MSTIPAELLKYMVELEPILVGKVSRLSRHYYAHFRPLIDDFKVRLSRPSGEIYTRCMVLPGGAKHGLETRFNINMIKISEVNYVDGKRQGECRKFWTDGTIRATINYTDDLKDGVYEYRSGDSIFERKTYKKGKLNGVKISYTDNRIFEVMNYVNGKLHGAYVKYGDSIVFVDEYVDGVKHGDSYQYNVDSGNVIYHCYYVDGMREGTANAWFNNGVLCFTCEYVNDRPIDGEIMIYDEYGNLSTKYRNFNGYKLHVYTRFYSRDGTLTQIGHRAALSNTTNNYMKFYESGNINEKLFIVNGKKVIYRFHENGEFMDKQTLKDI